MTIQNIEHNGAITVILTDSGAEIPIPTFRAPAGLATGHRIERDDANDWWAVLDRQNALVGIIKAGGARENRI